jgi:hypothetical protein
MVMGGAGDYEIRVLVMGLELGNEVGNVCWRVQA